MALTYSSMLDLQTDLIDFELHNVVDDNTFSSSELNTSKPTLIMFICNHCPYVIHYHDEIKRLALDYLDKFNFVAISSNDIENYPQDSPEKMRELWINLGLSFPYLYDETQEVAKMYKAECTPEFYLFNVHRRLVYRGRMDATTPSSEIEPNANDLRAAIKNLLNNEPVSDQQYPSMGCNIKWKPS